MTVSFRICFYDWSCSVFFNQVKGVPIAKYFSSYGYFRIRHGSKWSPEKFQSDDVIMGSTGVKQVINSSRNFDKRVDKDTLNLLAVHGPKRNFCRNAF